MARLRLHTITVMATIKPTIMTENVIIRAIHTVSLVTLLAGCVVVPLLAGCVVVPPLAGCVVVPPLAGLWRVRTVDTTWCAQVLCGEEVAARVAHEGFERVVVSGQARTDAPGQFVVDELAQHTFVAVLGNVRSERRLCMQGK